MTKWEELTNPESCMSKADNNEITFVLLARDAAAPVAIRAWVSERVRLGKNLFTDVQITEALECAARMEDQHNDRLIKKLSAPFHEQLREYKESSDTADKSANSGGGGGK